MFDTIILVVLGLFILAMICSIVKLIMKIKAFRIEEEDRPVYADSNDLAERKNNAGKRASGKGKSFFGWTDQEEEEEEVEEERAERRTRSKDRGKAAVSRGADPKKPARTSNDRKRDSESQYQGKSNQKEKSNQKDSSSQFLLCLAESGHTISLKEGKQYVCGRSEECDFVFTLPFISRQHCLLEVEGGNVYLYDNQSTNGIEVNGAKVRRGIQLNSGDTVGVNQHVLFQIQIQKPHIYLGENYI